MILQPEDSKICFKRLLQESHSQKFHNSLEHVKKACDAIENMKGLLNYSRVAQYTEIHYGSPKRQSIMNSKRLRLYIDVRKQEYTEKSPRSKHNRKKSAVPQYPCSKLDLKTKVYIDQLRARNAFLEKAMSNLQQKILQETRRNPIDIDESVTAGAQDDLSMQLIRQNRGEYSDENLKLIRTAVCKLMGLADNHNCPLEIKSRDGKDVLVLETPIAKETVLFNDELNALKHLLLRIKDEK